MMHTKHMTVMEYVPAMSTAVGSNSMLCCTSAVLLINEQLYAALHT